MYQPINFQGLSLNKDELSVTNGELAVSAGVEIKDGSIRPSILTGTKIHNLIINEGVEEDEINAVLQFVHIVSGNEQHYIVSGDNALNFFSFEQVQTGDKVWSLHSIDTSFDANEVKSIDAIGNTLVVVLIDGTRRYLIWKEGEYHELAQQPPLVNFSFRLSEKQKTLSFERPTDGTLSPVGTGELNPNAAYVNSGVNTESALTIKSTGSGADIKDEYRGALKDAAMAVINSANRTVAEAGCFSESFMIRYCYRLYDGSMYMHSQPVFLPVFSDQSPVFVCNMIEDPGQISITGKLTTLLNEYYFFDGEDNRFGNPIYMKSSNIILRYAPGKSKLQYTLAPDGIADLKDWKDIIQSVDIFITPGISHLTTDRNIDSCVTKLAGTRYDGSIRPYDLDAFVWKDKDGNVLNDPNASSDNWHRFQFYALNLPEHSEKEYADLVNSQNAFFKLKSIKVEDLTAVSTFTDLPVEANIIKNIAAQELMVDDYKSHNKLMSEGSYVYNHRVNLYGLSEELFSGYAFPYCMPQINSSTTSENRYKIVELRVRLNTVEGDRIVGVQTPSPVMAVPANYFQHFSFFYPDERAVELIVVYTTLVGTTKVVARIPMEAHGGLNGASTRLDNTTVLDGKGDRATNYPVSGDVTLPMPSKIYTSEVDNPFYFPLNGINTVGTGSIIALASTTRPLSMGQFGQFPLMAFCSDGIWALEVSPTGTYSSIHPISREVITSPESLCQLEQSIVFISARGCFLLQGGDVRLLSDVLDGPNAIDYDLFPQFRNEMAAKLGDNATVLMDTEAPIKFLQHCSLAYDSVNNRVFAIDNENSGLMLVMDTFAFNWSYMAGPKDMHYVPGYPYAYMSFVNDENKAVLMCLDKSYDYLDTTEHAGGFLTRTLTFDQMYSTIAGYRQFMNVPVDNCHLFFYGSNDLNSWHYIGSSHALFQSRMPGHTFRHFRIGAVLKMRAHEQYMSCLLDITSKYDRP